MRIDVFIMSCVPPSLRLFLLPPLCSPPLHQLSSYVCIPQPADQDLIRTLLPLHYSSPQDSVYLGAPCMYHRLLPAPAHLTTRSPPSNSVAMAGGNGVWSFCRGATEQLHNSMLSETDLPGITFISSASLTQTHSQLFFFNLFLLFSDLCLPLLSNK